MKTKYKFIHFVKIEDKPKTSVWDCKNSKYGSRLGVVGYEPGWRQYCFYSVGDVVFSVGCLDDIKHFIGQLEQLRKDRE